MDMDAGAPCRDFISDGKYRGISGRRRDGGESVSHFKQNAFEQCAEPSGRTFFDGRGY